MKKKEKSYDIYLIILLLILACIFIVNYFWFCSNEILLPADSGDFRTNSVLIYQGIVNKETNLLKEYFLYSAISEKEQLITLPIIPLYAIFGIENNKIPVLFGGFFFFFFFILGTYFFGKELYGRRISFLSCLLLLFSKRLFFASRTLHNDLAVASVVILCYYFFIKSDFFASKNYIYLFMFFFGLGLLSKPSFLIILVYIFSFLILQSILNKEYFLSKILNFRTENFVHIIISGIIFLTFPLFMFKKIFSSIFSHIPITNFKEGIILNLIDIFTHFTIFFKNQFENIFLMYLFIISFLFMVITIKYHRKEHISIVAAILSFNLCVVLQILFFGSIGPYKLNNPTLFRVSYLVLPFYVLSISFFLFKIFKLNKTKKVFYILIVFLIAFFSLLLTPDYDSVIVDEQSARPDAYWNTLDEEIRLNYQEIIKVTLNERKEKKISVLFNNWLFYNSFKREPYLSLNKNKIFPMDMTRYSFLQIYTDSFFDTHFSEISHGNSDKYTNIAMNSDLILFKVNQSSGSILSEFYVPIKEKEKLIKHNLTLPDYILNQEYTKIWNVIKENNSSFRCIYNLSINNNSSFLIYEKI